MPRNEDAALWAAYVKGVKRKQVAAKKSAVLKKRKEIAIKTDTALPADLLVPHGSRSSVAHAERNNITLERRRERALRQGEIEIEAKLDLHGMRQNEAYAALEKFLARAVKNGDRTLLIITGKGSRTGKSVLRDNLTGWVEALLGSSLLALRPAALKHGGAGAFYLLLKRTKDTRA